MHSKALRRSGHEGRPTSELTHLRRSHRREIVQRRNPASPEHATTAFVGRPTSAPRVVARWTVDGNGRLGLKWSPTGAQPDGKSIASEEAMGDLDDVRSTEQSKSDRPLMCVDGAGRRGPRRAGLLDRGMPVG
jgi:hypothetical protein